MEREIVVEHMGDDRFERKWKASYNKGCWGLGRTSAEAIGEVIRTCPEMLEIKLTYKGIDHV